MEESMATSAKIIETAVQTALDTTPEVLRSGPYLVGQRVLPVEEFLALPDYPGQRDTALRFEYAKENQFKVQIDKHREVAAVAYNGNTYKVDGHTRAFGWATGELPRPESVIVTFYRADNESEFKRAYAMFDSSLSAKVARDEVQGAYALNKLKLQSNLLRKGSGIESELAAAVAYSRGELRLHGKVDLETAVRTFSGALKALDAINMPKPMMAKGFPAASLLMLHRDNGTAAEFLTAVAGKQGSSVGGEMDGVYVAQSYAKSDDCKKLKAERHGRRGFEKVATMASILLVAYANWQSDQKAKRYVSNMKAVTTFAPFAKTDGV
jgi:hypothetical protein